MDFSKSMAVAASGMRVQTERMKIISENIANANSTSPIKRALHSISTTRSGSDSRPNSMMRTGRNP